MNYISHSDWLRFLGEGYITCTNVIREHVMLFKLRAADKKFT